MIKVPGKKSNTMRVVRKTQYANRIVMEAYEKNPQFLQLHFCLLIPGINFKEVYSVTKEQLAYNSMWNLLKKKIASKCPYKVWISDIDYPELVNVNRTKNSIMQIYIDLTIVNQWKGNWCNQIDQEEMEQYVEECYWDVYGKMIDLI